MRKKILTTAIAALFSLGVLAPVAAADDQGVYNAWVSQDAAFSAVGKKYNRALEHKPPRTTRAARALKKALGLIKQVDAAVNAQSPSSDAGTRAKTAVLDSMNLFRLNLVHKLRGVRALAHHRYHRAYREAKRAQRLDRRSLKAENTARQAFVEAGVQIK